MWGSKGKNVGGVGKKVGWFIGGGVKRGGRDRTVHMLIGRELPMAVKGDSHLSW